MQSADNYWKGAQKGETRRFEVFEYFDSSVLNEKYKLCWICLFALSFGAIQTKNQTFLQAQQSAASHPVKRICQAGPNQPLFNRFLPVTNLAGQLKISPGGRPGRE